MINVVRDADDDEATGPPGSGRIIVPKLSLYG